ncbi:hypothetical protein AVEN_209410-1 [Araneus ventricosus]|uniref:Uncharacterized protein n=1 Tax=Araneus ventricosus TaxID=182803 RepID=A0A4Y2JQG3_ARAVE|nr:hypothetical protein AVEN_209410-1 [Araneus ventricosus]
MNHPALPRHPGNLNDSRCNSSSTEAGVLVAITGHGPTPLEGGNLSIGQYLSVPKDSFSNLPTTAASRKRLSLIGPRG